MWYFRINCTVVELKLTGNLTLLMSIPSINCTVVELKRANMLIILPYDRVLIVPLWN